MLWRGVKGSDTVGVAEQLLTVLQDALPDDATSLRGFYPVLEAAEAFEQQLYSRKLLSDSDHVLSSFAKDADAHFAYKKRRQVLAQARRLVRAAVCAPRGTRPTHTPLAITLTPQLVCLFAPQLTAEYHNSVPVVDSAEVCSLGPLPVDTGRSSAAATGSGGAGSGGGGGVSKPPTSKHGRGKSEVTIDDLGDDGLYFFRLPNCQVHPRCVSSSISTAGEVVLVFRLTFVTAACLQVSSSASALVKLAHATMKQACDGTTPRCANVLYHTARDAFDMFRAVVPCRFSDSLAAVPRLAMLLHNDCMYIAHHLLTIGHKYRDK